MKKGKNTLATPVKRNQSNKGKVAKTTISNEEKPSSKKSPERGVYHVDKYGCISVGLMRFYVSDTLLGETVELVAIHKNKAIRYDLLSVKDYSQDLLAETRRRKQ